MRGFLLLLCALGCLGVQARAPLTVIYDSGDTLPLAPYLPKPTSPERRDQSDAEVLLPFALPITTPSMQSGKLTVTPKALQYLRRPLFLVGSDPLSRQWLAARRTQLVDIGAAGLLVEVPDEEALKAVLLLAKGLHLVPASAEGFAVELGLTHYPVLLSKDGWEQ